MTKNEFDNEVKYRLFRSVQEILHPVISKKNISNNKIIVDEDILPIRVFYPEKVSNISKVMIYIHGNGKLTDCLEKYSDICRTLAMKTKCLLIAIEYDEEANSFPKNYYEVFNTIEYLYNRLEKDDISCDNIVLAGDSTGANIITALNYWNKDKINIKKEILFYPVLSSNYSNTKKYESFITNFHFAPRLLNNLDKYFKKMNLSNKEDESLLNPLFNKNDSTPNTLLFVGTTDLLKDEMLEYKNLYKDKVEYVELSFAEHGFLKNMDKELMDEIFDKINHFIV